MYTTQNILHVYYTASLRALSSNDFDAKQTLAASSSESVTSSSDSIAATCAAVPCSQLLCGSCPWRLCRRCGYLTYMYWKFSGWCLFCEGHIVG